MMIHRWGGRQGGGGWGFITRVRPAEMVTSINSLTDQRKRVHVFLMGDVTPYNVETYMENKRFLLL